MLTVGDVINRMRHNRGYGVQSPAAFYFVMNVLREGFPYYIYPELTYIADRTDEYSSAHCRRLFRIANHLQAESTMVFAPGSGATACAIAAGKRTAPCHIIGNVATTEAKRFLAKQPHCILHDDDIPDAPATILSNSEGIGLFYIGHTPKHEQILESIMPHVNKKSVIIVEGIHRTHTMRKWWKKQTEHPAVTVSFDLYSMGMLFFDTEYRKQNYTLLFK